MLKWIDHQQILPVFGIVWYHFDWVTLLGMYYTLAMAMLLIVTIIKCAYGKFPVREGIEDLWFMYDL